MKYKPGDKVKIKSLEWYKANECSGRVMCDGLAFLEMMTIWCGKELTIDLIYTDDRGSGYIMKEPHIQWRFTDGMIEDLVNAKPQEKMISLNDACEWIEKNFKSDGYFSLYYLGGIYTPKNIAKDFRKAMEK